MPNNNAIFWRNLCKILRLCQDIVLSIVSRLIYHLVIWLSFVWSFGNVLFFYPLNQGFYKNAKMHLCTESNIGFGYVSRFFDSHHTAQNAPC